MPKRDFYKVLDVPKTATEAEIKKAYRRLAMKYHPDRNPDDREAEESFKEAKEACEVLTDPHKRAAYDQYGHAGVEAIRQNLADGYWGNGMRVALGEKAGVAKVHLDLRRGDGPPGARFYNFAALTTTERLVIEQPDIAAGAVRAVVKAQNALKADPSRATTIGERLFRSEEASLIADLIARDAPFYDATISPEAVDGLNTFAKASGLIAAPIPYDRLVATQFRQSWNG